MKAGRQRAGARYCGGGGRLGRDSKNVTLNFDVREIIRSYSRRDHRVPVIRLFARSNNRLPEQRDCGDNRGQ